MRQPKDETTDQPTDLVPLNAIRTETALSRYPFHRIAKQGNVSIEIQRRDAAGTVTFLWEVSHNSRYGQPGPLAYKLDTLVVNRRIEEAGKPVPRVLRIGSLSEIARELDLGGNTAEIRRALRQNSLTAITAKITYRGHDGREHALDFSDTRYGVVFTGEKLPDGRRADAVYLVLHDIYREVLDRAIMRPLDYDYLKGLAPSAQRFYEIVSYQVYATLRYNLPRARLLYSDFCTYSTLTRYTDYDQVKKQMYKVHRPHLQSEYLDKVEIEPAPNSDGTPDWTMWYVPGAKARAEYQAFTHRRKFPRMQGQLFPEEELAAADADLLALVDPEAGGAGGEGGSQTEGGEGMPPDGETRALAEALSVQGLNRADAERLAEEKPEECRRQLAFLPFVTEFKKSRGAYLRSAIEQGFGPPKGYEEHEAEEKEKRRSRARADREKALQAREEARRGDWLAYVSQEARIIEESRPEAFSAFREHDAEKRRSLERLGRGKVGQRLLAEFDREEARLQRLAEFFRDHPAHAVLTFWEWDARESAGPSEYRQ